MSPIIRNHVEEVHTFISPYPELNAGLWSLFAGASILLGLRIWVKLTRRHGLWYDDYILIVTWVILLANNSLIVYEFGNGYVLKDSTEQWDDRMHILINISSCGTLIGQSLSKTAFGVTLLRMSNRWVKGVLWFCIITMNSYMIVKVILQWAKVCGKSSYQNWYRLNFCIGWEFRDKFKEGGNVYNIIMDFIFATIPWFITRGLEMRRAEKVGLCLTMSLGMIVAIVAAIRVGWKDEGNERDEYYMWRNGVSQVWYSSEITGTIMVQCIPILRPILRDFHTSLTSRKLGSTTDGGRSSRWTGTFNRDRASTNIVNNNNFNDHASDSPERMELGRIPEESSESLSDRTQTTPKEPEEIKQPTRVIQRADPWPLWENENRSGKSLDAEHDNRASHSDNGFDFEFQGQQGLSPPPRRPPQERQPLP